MYALQGKIKVSSRLHWQHTSFPCNQILCSLWECHTHNVVNLCYWLLSWFSFSGTFLFPLPPFLPPLLSSSFSSAQECAELTPPSLSLVTAVFPSHLSHFLCTPHAEVVVRGGSKLEGSRGKQLNLQPYLWETILSWWIFSTHIAAGDQSREKHLLFSSHAPGSPSDISAHCVFSASN